MTLEGLDLNLAIRSLRGKAEDHIEDSARVAGEAAAGEAGAGGMAI